MFVDPLSPPRAKYITLSATAASVQNAPRSSTCCHLSLPTMTYSVDVVWTTFQDGLTVRVLLLLPIISRHGCASPLPGPAVRITYAPIHSLAIQVDALETSTRVASAPVLLSAAPRSPFRYRSELPLSGCVIKYNPLL